MGLIFVGLKRAYGTVDHEISIMVKKEMRTFFLMYINDLTVILRCNVKLSADDASLLTVVHNPDAFTCDRNHGKNLIRLLAHNWRMALNPHPMEQAVEVNFSGQINTNGPSTDHKIITFDKHKHLGIVLDSRLTFESHIQATITNDRLGMGMLRFLSQCLPRQTLNELYKLYVRPHLDYGDAIYYTPQNICDFSYSIKLSNQMGKLESIQYTVAMAVTGAWKGTSRVKLYDELG